MSRDMGSVRVRKEHQGHLLPAPDSAALPGQVSAHPALGHPPPRPSHLGQQLGVVNVFWKEEIKSDIYTFLVS